MGPQIQFSFQDICSIPTFHRIAGIIISPNTEKKKKKGVAHMFMILRKQDLLGEQDSSKSSKERRNN